MPLGATAPPLQRMLYRVSMKDEEHYDTVCSVRSSRMSNAIFAYNLLLVMYVCYCRLLRYLDLPQFMLVGVFSRQ